MPGRRTIPTAVGAITFAVLIVSALTLVGPTGATFSATTSNSSNTLGMDTLDPPTSLTATDGETIQLDWSVTADGYANGYRVFRSATGGGPYAQVGEVKPSSAITYTDPAPDGTYYYVLRAFYGAWESIDSPEASARSWLAFDCPGDPDLRACIRFDDDTGGTYVDGSSYGNDVAITNGIQVEGISDQAADGSETAQYEILDSASLDLDSAFTMEMWVKLDSLPTSGRVGFIDNDGQYAVMYYAGEGIRCSSALTSLPKVAISAGAWTHIACVWDGTTLTLYLDGTVATSAASSGTNPTSNTDPVSLLDTSPGYNEPMDGAMDNLRIWSTSRTQAQICADAGLSC